MCQQKNTTVKGKHHNAVYEWFTAGYGTVVLPLLYCCAVVPIQNITARSGQQRQLLSPQGRLGPRINIPRINIARINIAYKLPGKAHINVAACPQRSSCTNMENSRYTLTDHAEGAAAARRTMAMGKFRRAADAVHLRPTRLSSPMLDKGVQHRPLLSSPGYFTLHKSWGCQAHIVQQTRRHRRFKSNGRSRARALSIVVAVLVAVTLVLSTRCGSGFKKSTYHVCTELTECTPLKCMCNYVFILHLSPQDQ